MPAAVEDAQRRTGIARGDSAAGKVLKRSSRAEITSVGALMRSSAGRRGSGALSTLIPANRSDSGSIALTMPITRSRSASGAAATSSGLTPTNRISTNGTSVSASHQMKSAPTLTSQNASRLPRLPSMLTAEVGA